jgi:hypothetical protein
VVAEESRRDMKWGGLKRIQEEAGEWWLRRSSRTLRRNGSRRIQEEEGSRIIQEKFVRGFITKHLSDNKVIGERKFRKRLRLGESKKTITVVGSHILRVKVACEVACHSISKTYIPLFPAASL